MSSETSLMKGDLDFKIYNSINDISRSFWESEIKHRYFLSYNYLQTIEKTCLDQSFRYVAVYHQESFVAIYYFQLFNIRGKNLYDYVPDTTKLIQNIFQKSISWIDAELLVLGNVIFTCEHGVHFKDNNMSACYEMTVDAIAKANASISNGKMRGIMISENIFPNSNDFFRKNGFHNFRSEDRMEMNISKFNSFDDYKSKLSSKYRTRLKKVISLNKDTEVVDINIDNYSLYSDKIKELFSNVLKNSKFNIAKLSDKYFLELLKNQTRFKVKGYVVDSKLVSFVSFFELKEIIEVHYVGIDYEVNKTNKVYNHMLYDIIRHGIEHTVPAICFSRTSQELKSTLGAYPVAVNSLLKINNRFYNIIASFFLKRLKPKEWVQRKPYKS